MTILRALEMDRGAVINSISGRSRAILGLFLIISIPLLLVAIGNYQNSSSILFPSWLKPKETLSGDKPKNETANHSTVVAPTNTSAEKHSLGSSRNDSFPFAIPISSNQTFANLTDTSVLQRPSHRIPISINNSSPSTTINSKSNTKNKLLGGLLPIGFDKKTCLSRYQAHLYRKPSTHKPSAFLISKLRSYEHLHRRCGPTSRKFNRTLRMLKKTQQVLDSTDCNYIVWLPVNGLGNRMVSLAAAFLYALLTDRVLLVAFESDISGVFCEPFLNSTWKLPYDFPHRHQIADLPTYESMVKNIMGGDNATTSANMKDVPPFLFVHLQHQREEHERFFHCSEGQMVLKRVPVLFLRSDQYFVPSLFMIPSFQDEINRMFPEKDSVFHHLGRYLFSPSNEAWRLITKFYKKNLSMADQKVGIQVRVFAANLTPAKTIMEQILACTLKNNILPKIDDSKEGSSPLEKNVTSMAVLVTSLYKEYSENLTAIYSTRPRTTGETVRVYQPSHEEVQKFHNNSHHVMALTEMYLLSLCDVLVTSGQSTFGYVAQGLGALKPWIMHKTVGTKFRDPPCQKAKSMEPCFHFAPRYDCKRRIKVDHISSVFPHMKQCEDIGTGVKMVS